MPQRPKAEPLPGLTEEQKEFRRLRELIQKIHSLATDYMPRTPAIGNDVGDTYLRLDSDTGLVSLHLHASIFSYPEPAAVEAWAETNRGENRLTTVVTEVISTKEQELPMFELATRAEQAKVRVLATLCLQLAEKLSTAQSIQSLVESVNERLKQRISALEIERAASPPQGSDPEP